MRIWQHDVSFIVSADVLMTVSQVIGWSITRPFMIFFLLFNLIKNLQTFVSCLPLAALVLAFLFVENHKAHPWEEKGSESCCFYFGAAQSTLRRVMWRPSKDTIRDSLSMLVTESVSSSSQRILFVIIAEWSKASQYMSQFSRLDICYWNLEEIKSE